MKQPDVIKIPLTAQILGLSPVALGVFVKLLALGSRMTVMGVMVNGHVYAYEEICDTIKCTIENSREGMKELAERGLVKTAGVGRVMFIPEAYAFYNGASYTDAHLVSVVGTVREAFGAKVAEEVASVVHDAGKFTEVKSVDEYREQLISTYALFGEHRNRVLEYVGCFRTKRQIETGAKMDPVRHLRILEELLSIYQTGLFPYDGKQYVVTQEQLMSVIDNVANRKMVHLKNHNYLKMVLKNQPSKKNETEARNEPVAGSAKSYR